MTRAAPLAVVYDRGHPPSGAAAAAGAAAGLAVAGEGLAVVGGLAVVAGLVVPGAWATSGVSGVANKATMRTVATRAFMREVISMLGSLFRWPASRPVNRAKQVPLGTGGK